MKIGILTLPLHTNYGGILQVYALQTVLERMGHNVFVLDKGQIRHLKVWEALWIYPKRFAVKYVKRKNIDIFAIRHHNKIFPIISQYTQLFIDKYIHVLRVNDFSKLNSHDFDAIVVGSDQIWRPEYNEKIENAYLQFAELWNIKRIAYAVSFGTDKWGYTAKQTNTCAALANKFKAVSVREESGIHLCHDYLGIDAQLVLDPTMLLSAEDYMEIVEKSNVKTSSGNLLCYILDENEDKHKLIDLIAKEKKLIPFRVNSKVENKKASISERVQPPVEQWIRGFYDAEFIITDSFHACVFSILFNKPFIVYGNEERGISRFVSLLQIFGLENRLILNSGEYSSKIGIYSNKDAGRKLSALRTKSYAFLRKEINE